MKNILYISDFPYSVGFGGKEIQLNTYCNLFLDKKKFSGSKINYWDLNALDNCDILHIFGYSGWYRGILQRVKSKFPHIKIVCSPNFYRDNEFFYINSSRFLRNFPLRNYFSEINDFLNLTDLIICNSIEEKKQLSKSYNINCNISVIPNGIEDDYFINDFDNCEINQDFALSVGFFDDRKNTLRMLEAFLLSIKYHNLVLILVGELRFSNSENVEKFHNLINSSNGRIINIGFLDRNSIRLKKLYKNCKFHILPSILETPGLTNLEALSFGKNIIVGDCKPIREYLNDIPIYCNPKSVKDIMRSILYAIKMESNINLFPENLLFSNISRKLNLEYENLYYQ
jgi:glycosyltransferase involved in cell wall biosynthesis